MTALTPVDRQALARHVRRAGRTPLWLTLDAPLVPIETLLKHPEARAAWAPALRADDTPIGGAEQFVAIGAARVFTAAGENRFASMREQTQAVLASLQREALHGAPELEPRCVGGFAFQCGRARLDPWTAFGEAQFILPRLMYTRFETTAALSVVIPTEADAAEQALEQALSLRDELAVLNPKPLAAQLRSDDALAHCTHSEVVGVPQWTQLVTAALREIATGAVRKIVIARRTTNHFDTPISVARSFAELGAGRASSTRFMFRAGQHSFLGVTPERLIKKSGLELSTEALAGTFRLARSQLATELLRSPKEHEEHRPVVAAIVEHLQPFTKRLTYPSDPVLTELPQLLHLRTPIQGELAAPCHILDLVEALHPTPAVGGQPSAPALGWIAANEAHERGWYAGPVGWFNPEGDGEFVVALRSGVVRGNRVDLYAGAGIVHGSDPSSEYDETELKFGALASALCKDDQASEAQRASAE